MIPLASAQEELLSLATALPARRLPLAEALGLVLAEQVVARETVPHFTCSAMDGYALRSADATRVPVELAVVGTLMAGDAPSRAVGPGEAIRIMTGAPLPEGADAVCMVEETAPAGGGRAVLVRREARPGLNVRRAGEDLEVGQLVAEPGTVLGARHLGVLASIGVGRVLARGRPRVGVLSTGSELRGVDADLRPGQIRDSNRYLLLGLLAQAGAVPVDLGVVADEEDLVAQALADAGRRCDLLLTSGGVSVGDKDVIKALLERSCGPTGRALQVAIKPAKPLAFGLLRDSGTPLVGLPGNPVSSAVAFECFALPLLRALAGHPRPLPATIRAETAEPFSRRPDGRLHLVPVALEAGADGRLRIRRAGGDGSHLLASTLGSDALAHLPDGDGVPAGTLLEVFPLTGSPPLRPAGTAEPAEPGAEGGPRAGAGGGGLSAAGRP